MTKINVYNKELDIDHLKFPIKIALLGDFHITKSSGPILKKAVEILNKNPANIICLIGDFVQDFKSLSLLNLLSGIKNKNIFAVLGNHDFGMAFPWQKPNFEKAKIVENFLEKMGITVLRNEKVKLKIKNQEISIVGIEDIWAKPRPKKFFRKATILLCHNPDIIFHKISGSSSLILSGHTHAGSVNLFPLKQLFCFLNCRTAFKKPKGLFIYKHRRVFITSGVGKLGGFIRIGITPEIVYLTLKPHQ